MTIMVCVTWTFLLESAFTLGIKKKKKVIIKASTCGNSINYVTSQFPQLFTGKEEVTRLPLRT